MQIHAQLVRLLISIHALLAESDGAGALRTSMYG